MKKQCILGKINVQYFRENKNTKGVISWETHIFQVVPLYSLGGDFMTSKFFWIISTHDHALSKKNNM